MSKLEQRIVSCVLSLACVCALTACESRLQENLTAPTSSEEAKVETSEVKNPEEKTSTHPEVSSSVIPEKNSVFLGDGLILKDVSSYAGIYMEDGSNEVVNGLMSVLIENTSDKDLQLARITLNYEESYQFEVTNLPAGSSAILLEKNRKPMPEGSLVTAIAENVAFFQESMDTYDDMFKISGMDGALNVKNISSNDINGNIYVYYKYIADDTYYGGITFRTKVEGGLKAGEIHQVMTGHFDPDNCKITMVTYE